MILLPSTNFLLHPKMQMNQLLKRLVHGKFSLFFCRCLKSSLRRNNFYANFRAELKFVVQTFALVRLARSIIRIAASDTFEQLYRPAARFI